MSTTAQLIDALKRELKAKGITYAELAQRLGISEASVKRTFALRSFSLERLEQVLAAVGMDFMELAQAATDAPQLCLGERNEILAVPQDFAGDPPARSDDAEDRAERNALARAGLANEPKDLTRRHLERDIVDRDQRTLSRSELGAKVPDVEYDGFFLRCHVSAPSVEADRQARRRRG